MLFEISSFEINPLFGKRGCKLDGMRVGNGMGIQTTLFGVVMVTRSNHKLFQVMPTGIIVSITHGQPVE